MSRACDASSFTSPRLLVHSPTPSEASQYASLIRARHPDVDIVLSTNSAEAEARVVDADIVMGSFFPPSMFARATRLRWVHKVSAGVEDVAFHPDIGPDVVLTRSDGACIAPRMIEYVLGAIFSIVQRFPRAFAQQRERRWASFPVSLARGSTVGIAGLGDIGSAIARAVAANGMQVIGWRRTPAPLPVVDRVYAGRAELPVFAAACDFLVLVLPATAETRGLFTQDVFSIMKRSAWLINVGRGATVDEDALANAIAAGRIAGAVLDVVATEPLPEHSRLWTLDNVVITPHVSGPIVPEEVIDCFLDNLDAFRRGLSLARRVDRARGY